MPSDSNQIACPRCTPPGDPSCPYCEGTYGVPAPDMAMAAVQDLQREVLFQKARAARWKSIAEELHEALAGGYCIEHGYARETMKQFEDLRLRDKDKETEVNP